MTHQDKTTDDMHSSLRREFLADAGGGFAGLALVQLLMRDATANAVQHHPPKVRRVIQLFMTGGASPMDTYDYKPELARLHGQMLTQRPDSPCCANSNGLFMIAPAGATNPSGFSFGPSICP